MLQAGPRVLEMSSDTLNVPKIGTSVTAAMTAENAEISASDLVAERVQLVARKAAALTRASNEVLSDSNPALREVSRIRSHSSRAASSRRAVPVGQRLGAEPSRHS